MWQFARVVREEGVHERSPTLFVRAEPVRRVAHVREQGG